jgi:D-aminopeptidase
VTVVLPHRGNLFLEKVPAAIEVINGYGKTMGSIQVNELGTIETPIALTSTLSVGRVADGLVSHALSETSEIGIATSTVNPVVGECSDSFLNDMQGRHVHASHVLRAIASSASGPIAEGSIGAGTGMSCFGFKGGIGTSSRQIPSALGGWFIGVLVLSNFGQRRQLVIDGVPVGRLLDDESTAVPERGSIMIVVATNAPLSDRQLRRVARRAGFGLARTGSVAGHGSGDVVIAFSNHPSVRVPHYGSGWSQSTEFLAESGPDASSAAIDALFTATIEATEEAILNSLFTAETVTGRDGHRRDAIPVERVLHIMQRYRNA